MGLEEGATAATLLLPNNGGKPPTDTYHLAYVIYFILGVGFLLPLNAFITAVDYFSYLYPGQRVDRIFYGAYFLIGLISLLVIVLYPKKSDAYVRINWGSALFIVALLVVPLMDVGFTMGRSGLYGGFYVTVVAVGLSGLADALVQGGLIGTAGEMPERYMQAVVAGNSASGVLVCFLRIFTKAVYPQNIQGLRNSAILYFVFGIILMIVCVIFYNVAHRLPVIKYYNDLKKQAANENDEDKGPLSGPVWEIMGTMKWHVVGIVVTYVVSVSIFPGFITEDVHSAVLKDWYPILLITTFNVFDLVGKSLTSIYLPEKANAAISACFARLLFYPLYWGCLHGPEFFRTEIPVTLLTCLLGLTNGYLMSVLMILAPKTVQLKHADTAGILIVLFSNVGLASGSVVSWFWVI